MTAAIQSVSWLGGSMPSAPMAGRINHLMRAPKQPKAPGKCKRADRPRAVRRTPKIATQEWHLPPLVPSLRDRINELFLRRLGIAIVVARVNNRLAARLREVSAP